MYSKACVFLGSFISVFIFHIFCLVVYHSIAHSVFYAMSIIVGGLT